MRLLHTGDWHLCDRLGRVDRTDDLSRRVEQVAAFCDEHAIDVLIIAGDVFSEHASVDEMTKALEHLHTAFAGFFERGGTILAVTGNHDREARVELIRQGMRLATPDAATRRFHAGRMYLLNRPYHGLLETRAGEQAQFVLVPYPTPVRYGEPADRFRSKEEENQVLNGRVAQWLNDARQDIDPKLATIMIAHLHVIGSELPHTLYRLTEQDDVRFDTGVLPVGWAYIALGHIHKPQALPGLPNVRYCGSLDRLDLGEIGDDKSVVLLDVGPEGLVRSPEVLSLPATPMHDVTIADPGAELDGLAERYADHETALVRVSVTHVPGGPSRHEIERAIRATFPRHTAIHWARPVTAEGGATDALRPAADYRATVRDYLDRELKEDADRGELLKLVESFLTTEEAP